MGEVLKDTNFLEMAYRNIPSHKRYNRKGENEKDIPEGIIWRLIKHFESGIE